MRFTVEYLDAKTKETKLESISLLNSFLNFHLIEKFHGWSYECLFVKLINNAPSKKKWKVSRSDDQWGNIEVPFDPCNKTHVEEFNLGFVQVKHAVNLASTLEIKGLTDFRYKQLISDLTNLEQIQPKSNEEYDVLLNQKSAMDSQLQLRRVNGRIKAYKDYPMPHSRRLMNVRIYDHFDNAELMPYRYMYAEILGTLLRNANILTPGYQEIYFSIDETLDAAKRELAFEKWHKYTYCAINMDQYRKETADRKEQMLLDSLIDGLRLIADFDHLDKQKIETVIETVSKTKCRTQLTYAVKENNSYQVRIQYEVGPDHTQMTPFYIVIRNKTTNKEVTRLIDNFNILWVAYCISKIKLLRDRVEILGGGGLRGHISRDMGHIPDRYEFVYTNLNL